MNKNEGSSLDRTNDRVHPKIALTQNMEVASGAHFLYLYEDEKKYLDNACTFLAKGLELNHAVILLESPDMYEEMKHRLYKKGFSSSQIEAIVFTDHCAFYGTHHSFDIETILANIQEAAQFYKKNGRPIRIWSKVLWHQSTIHAKEIPLYEQKSDELLKPFQIFTVCSYNSNKIPANMAIGLMKGHSYVMTDDELMASMYYQNDFHIPSLFIEENLEEKVHHYQNAIEKMPDAVLIVRKFHILYWNNMAEELLECGAYDLMSKSVMRFFHPDEHPLIQARAQKMERGEQVPLVEMKMVTLTGRIVYIEIAAFPFSHDMLNDFTVILIIRSINDRKANRQLTIKAEKLSLAGQLAASIAHEIRNPLTSIKGFMKLAQEDVMHDEYYTIIEDEIDRIETIASELLVLGKPVSLEIEVGDVGKMVRDVCMLLQPQAVMRKIDLQYEAIEPACFIRCNTGQMKQVFINLIKNATEAMENGGIIRTSVQSDGEKVRILIADEGKGMPEHVLKKIGEPFYSTKEDGTGLGLMVCFTIVEQYNGTIKVESVVNEGTTFTIELPAYT